MELHYKTDWEQTKERMTAWWAHEDFGRCAMAVTAPKAGIKYEDPPRLPEKKEDWWIDFDYLKAINEYRMSRTYYGGEAVPAWNTGDGWINHAGFVGCPVTLLEVTAWVEPIIAEGELTDYDYRSIVIDPDNWWWKFSDQIHRLGVEEARGKSIPAIQTLGGCADTLAAMRGSQNLIYDVMDCPEYVREFDLYLMKQWIEIHDKFYSITKEAAEGSTAWPGLNVWAPGRFYFAMCDFSYMISPKMFRAIFLPSIEMQLNYLDYSIYHLDGVGAFAHVDALCELPKLNGIQVVPGDGKPNALHYMDMLKKIQRAGKNLQILLPPEDVETALENLSSKGLLITTRCKTEEQGRQLLKMAERLGSPRRAAR
jgi:hypothetical protein